MKLLILLALIAVIITFFLGLMGAFEHKTPKQQDAYGNFIGVDPN